MKMIWNNKPFPSLNVINGKTYPYGSKGILRHYHYPSDPKLGPGIFVIRKIPCSFHTCKTTLSISWNSKSNKQLISLDMLDYMIANTLKCLVFVIPGF